MSRVEPFRGIVYNSKKVGNLKKVIAPPYDVISPEEQDGFYNAHPNNIIRLILNKAESGDNQKSNKYTRAAEFFKSWRKDDVLRRDDEPSFYFYVQNYSLPTGESFQREGFFGRLELSPFEEKKVIPHEYTLSKPRKDRMNLMMSCRAHLSPIFVLYNDPKKTVEKYIKKIVTQKPYLNVTDSKAVRHRAWRISDPKIVNAVERVMNSKTFIIADGHHRYNAALEVREKIRKRQKKQAPAGQPYDYTMAYFCNMRSPGLTILPIHRMVHSVSRFSGESLLNKMAEFYDISEIGFAKSRLKGVLRELQEKLLSPAYVRAGSLGLFFPGEDKFYLLKGKKAALRKALIGKGTAEGFLKLDVIALHELVLQQILKISRQDMAKQKNIKYINGIVQLPPVLKKGDFQALFLMNPITFPVKVLQNENCQPVLELYC